MLGLISTVSILMWRRNLASSAVGCAFLFYLLRASAAPANDSFAAATIITNFPVVLSGDTIGATAEPGEPAEGLPPQESIWWLWTAPFTGRIGVVDDGSVPAAWLKVFTGNSFGSLTNIISNNLYILNVINVVAGMTYHLAVDINGSPDAAGPIQFRLVNLAAN